MTGKAEIRRSIDRILAAMNGEKRRLAAASAGDNLIGHPAWRGSRNVLIFMAMATEITTEAVVRAALDEGKTVFIPRVVEEQLEFGAIETLDHGFETGSFGIREPLSSAKKWNPTTSLGPSLVIVPGLAFDSKGNRLGRGGGFYDRFIRYIRWEAASSGAIPPLCLGLAYERQLVENLPTEAHDQMLDGLVTEARVRMFQHG